MKYALVTGCSKGLGKALAFCLLSSGYVVFPIVRRKESEQEWSTAMPGMCYPILADISMDSSIEIIRASVGRHCSSLDILINNAGIPGIEPSLEKTSSLELQALFNVHCLGALRVSQACLPFLKEASAPLILNISSRLGSLGKMSKRDFPEGEFSYSYRVAKAAQNMLTLCMAQELEKWGIKIHAVHPGRMKTDSAAAKATLDPGDAAKAVVEWVERNEKLNTGMFFEPGVGELPW
jgi:NAD(P)-dependent dehydrogenase (short-subunit alcohol dehydrogenase family)